MRSVTLVKGFSAAMFVADQIHEHQARCAAPLFSLRMLAQGEAGAPLPRRVMVEITQATSAVLAEAEAAGRAALATARVRDDHPGDEAFLRVRLDRLAAAADDAIAAARNGDPGEMRRHLRHFDVLTAAIWTVQDAVYGSRRVSAATLGADRRRIARLRSFGRAVRPQGGGNATLLGTRRG